MGAQGEAQEGGRGEQGAGGRGRESAGGHGRERGDIPNPTEACFQAKVQPGGSGRPGSGCRGCPRCGGGGSESRIEGTVAIPVATGLAGKRSENREGKVPGLMPGEFIEGLTGDCPN